MNGSNTAEYCILGWFKSGKNDKLDIFLLFRPDSESFGKWCLEKCKKFFDSTTLMPAESVPKFYYITHLCEMEQDGKFNVFQASSILTPQ